MLIILIVLKRVILWHECYLPWTKNHWVSSLFLLEMYLTSLVQRNARIAGLNNVVIQNARSDFDYIIGIFPHKSFF